MLWKGVRERYSMNTISGCSLNTLQRILYKEHCPMNSVTDDVYERWCSRMRIASGDTLYSNLNGDDAPTGEQVGKVKR